MKRAALLSIVSLFLFTNCSKKNARVISGNENFFPQLSSIAILPFEVYTYGQIDKEMTDDMLHIYEEGVSLEYQTNYYKQILEKQSKAEKELFTHVQDYEITNTILSENGISSRDSWEYEPQDLAKILKVDAVLVARVEKEQFRSDGYSAFVDISSWLLAVLTDIYIDDSRSNNKEILFDYALVDSKGKVLWVDGEVMPYKWRNKTENVMKRAINASVKSFPYCSNDSRFMSN